MKKFILGVAALAAITMGFSSCNKAPKAELKSETDSLAYSYGMTTSRGLKEYLVRLEVDTTKNMDAFIKGFLKATKDMSDEEKAEMVKQISSSIYEKVKSTSNTLNASSVSKSVNLKTCISTEPKKRNRTSKDESKKTKGKNK